MAGDASRPPSRVYRLDVHDQGNESVRAALRLATENMPPRIRDSPPCILCRSNANVLNAALWALDHFGGTSGNGVHILGGVKKAEDIIKNFTEVYKVYVNDRSRTLHKSFSDLQDLKKFAEWNRMSDVVSQCNFVEQHGHGTGDVLKRIRAHVTDVDEPHVMVAGTIHQSKVWRHSPIQGGGGRRVLGRGGSGDE